jgi:hypothetical protein
VFRLAGDTVGFDDLAGFHQIQSSRQRGLRAAVQEVSARVKRLALMLDTCDAEALNVRVRGLGDLSNNIRWARGISLVTKVAQRAPDAFILGSSTEDENSWEDASYRLPGERNGHGLFHLRLAARSR